MTPTVVPSQPISFAACVISCGNNFEFVRNVDQLKGTSFATMHRLPVGPERDKQCAAFCDVIRELVWNRLDPSMRVLESDPASWRHIFRDGGARD